MDNFKKKNILITGARFFTEEGHQKAHHFNGGMNDAPK